MKMINENWGISWQQKGQRTAQAWSEEWETNEGRQMKINVKNEVEGKWLQQGRMYPLLLHRSPGITMAHKWQQRVPKACITLADPYADMEADTVHKTSWRDTFKTQTSKLTCHKDKGKHIQVHLDLKFKGLHGGTKQEWSWTKCKASRVKKRRDMVVKACLDHVLRGFMEAEVVFWIQRTE